MKTFLNVLYRRILYKIPLKFLLVLLAVCAVFIACFSSAGLYEGGGAQGSVNAGASSTYGNVSGADFVCIKQISCNTYKLTVSSISYTVSSNIAGKINCFPNPNHTSYVFENLRTNSCSFYHFPFNLNAIAIDNGYLTQNSCDLQYSGYILPSSCPSCEICPSCPTCPSCPSGSGSISNVYINDILHVGAPFIYMNIPDEIDWDYAYTQGGTNMNIDVVGYNQDTEKIDGIITIQNYKPDGADLSTLVSDIIPLFVPGLCIILLLYFIFRFIKKIF